MIQSLTKKILNTNGQIKAASSIRRLGLYYPKKIRYISPMGIEFHSFLFTKRNNVTKHISKQLDINFIKMNNANR